MTFRTRKNRAVREFAFRNGFKGLLARDAARVNFPLARQGFMAKCSAPK
jgi:hypothetical protein